MLFRNAIVYRLPADWSVPPAELEARLEAAALQPCGPFDMSSRGWVSAGPTQRFVHTVAGHHLVALGLDQKILPAAVIRQVAQERAAELAEGQGYPVGRRQMRELKLRVTEELRARALSRRSVTRAWLDPQGGWCVVEASGAKRAEMFVESMRAALETFAVLPLKGDRAPAARMSGWLRHGDVPGGWLIEPELELKAVDKSKAVVRWSRQPFDSRDVLRYLDAGLAVSKLGLTWRDKVSLVATDELALKRIEFLGLSAEPGDGGGEVDAAAQFDVDFALMAGELSQLIADLDAAIGGAG